MDDEERKFAQTQAGIIREFQRCRSATLQACTGWFAALLILSAGVYGFGDLEQWHSWRLLAMLFPLAGIGYCGWRIYRVTQSELRCPNCDVVPKDADDEGFPPNPAQCSFCGMKLR